MRSLFILSLLLFFPLAGTSLELNSPGNGYVTVGLSGQFGNQLFQIATAYAYALDHNLTLTIPDLLHAERDNIQRNAKELFLSRINGYNVPYPIHSKWTEPSFNYHVIPSKNTIELHGYFQSEKYFSHRRTELLSLFAMPQELKKQIFNKFPFLFSDTFVVGVQIRDYRSEQPTGQYHPTINRSYYEKAMSYFPEDTIFLVSSNNIKYAKDCTQGLRKNIIYLQNSTNYIEEFYTLVLCKSFIISNSTFGWWAAWLSTTPNKIVIAPNPWFSLPYNNKIMTKDILPKEWIVIQN